MAVTTDITSPPDVQGVRRSFNLSGRLVPLSFMLPAILYLAVMFGYPIAYNLQMSLQHVTVGTFLTGAADFAGFDNYLALLRDPLFWRSLQQTAIFTVFSIVGQMSIGMCLALFFWRSFPLSTGMRALLLVPWLLPLVVSATTFRWIFDLDGGVLNHVIRMFGGERVGWLTNEGAALFSVIVTNIWVGIPFSMAVFYSGLQSLPREILEAAELDGANRWQRFWTVVLPMLAPLTAVVFTLSVIYTVKVFDLIFILTGGGPANATQTLATYAYQLSFRNLDFSRGAVLGNILILISLVFAVFYLRSFRKSLQQEAE